jgi:hypothetical protein
MKTERAKELGKAIADFCSRTSIIDAREVLQEAFRQMKAPRPDLQDYANTLAEFAKFLQEQYGERTPDVFEGSGTNPKPFTSK